MENIQSILVKSEDRTTSSTSSSNFSIEFPHVLEGYYRVSYIQLPHTIYNVKSGLNDTIYTSLGNAILTSGYYSTSAFANHAQTVLQAVDNNFAVSYNSNTNAYTITNTAAFTLDFGTNTSQSARKLLGFSQSDTSSALTQTSDRAVNLNSTNTVIIDIKESRSQLLSSDLNQNGCLVVYLNEPYGSYINQAYTDIPQHVDLGRTKKLSFVLRDPEGNVVDLRGADWSLLLTKRIQHF